MTELDDSVLYGSVTPERAIDLLEMIKREVKNTSIILGIDSGNEIKDFMLVEETIEAELQAEMVLAGSCSKTKRLNLLNLSVSDFKEVLQLANINPDDLIGDVNEFAATVEDMAIDKGAIFSDEVGGLITVSTLEDKRTLRDFMSGNNDDGIWITFGGSKIKSKMAGNSYNLTEVRNLIGTKRLSALF